MQRTVAPSPLKVKDHYLKESLFLTPELMIVLPGTIYSRIITNAEEIAFYGGQNVERANLRGAYRSLLKQTYTIMRQKLWYVMVEQFLLKYGWAGEPAKCWTSMQSCNSSRQSKQFSSYITQLCA